MDPIKALGRAGVLGSFLNKFDGGVEILDDLDDHWTSKNHKAERNWFVQELQEIAAEKSVRVTYLRSVSATDSSIDLSLTIPAAAMFTWQLSANSSLIRSCRYQKTKIIATWPM